MAKILRLLICNTMGSGAKGFGHRNECITQRDDVHGNRSYVCRDAVEFNGHQEKAILPGNKHLYCMAEVYDTDTGERRPAQAGEVFALASESGIEVAAPVPVDTAALVSEALKDKELSFATISQVTGLTKEQVETLAKELGLLTPPVIPPQNQGASEASGSHKPAEVGSTPAPGSNSSNEGGSMSEPLAMLKAEVADKALTVKALSNLTGFPEEDIRGMVEAEGSGLMMTSNGRVKLAE